MVWGQILIDYGGLPGSILKNFLHRLHAIFVSLMRLISFSNIFLHAVDTRPTLPGGQSPLVHAG